MRLTNSPATLPLPPETAPGCGCAGPAPCSVSPAPGRHSSLPSSQARYLDPVTHTQWLKNKNIRHKFYK